MRDNFIIRLCIPKKSASVRVYSDDDKTIADRFNQFFYFSWRNNISKTQTAH